MRVGFFFLRAGSELFQLNPVSKMRSKLLICSRRSLPLCKIAKYEEEEENSEKTILHQPSLSQPKKARNKAPKV